MRQLIMPVVLFLGAAVGLFADEWSHCEQPPLTDQQIIDLVARERAARKDLPPPPAQFRTLIRRQGCHYIYVEQPVPAMPEGNTIFKINQRGMISDVQPGSPTCPEKVFTEKELAEIVTKARMKRPDLPPPFPASRTRVERLRCLYQYFEYSLPEKRGNYQVFTVDPFGEVLDVIRPDPY